MVPDQRRGRVANLVSRIEEAPADVHVVARLAELLVESAHCQQRLAPEGHIATRDVLGEAVVEHDVTRPARAGRDAPRYLAVLRGRDVRAANHLHLLAAHFVDEVVQPVLVGNAVRVGVSKDFTLCDRSTVIARMTQSVVRLIEIAHVGKTGGDFASIIGRSIIDENDFIRRIIEFT